MRSACSVATLLVLSLSLGVIVPARALACWDGFHARVGSVEEMGVDETWDATTLRHRARWLGRIDALLPNSASVSVDHGYVTVTVGTSTHELEWADGDYLTLFREVARILGASPADIARARSEQTGVYVVQAGAFVSPTHAQTHADALSATDVATHGFLEAGGFPADNPEAHVVALRDARAAYRIYVGAFVDRAEAEALASALGHGAFVRAL